METYSPYVLIHGSGLGGWCWDEVKTHMEINGAQVFAPCIPDSCQTLQDAVIYITQIIKSNNLDDCILVGHSFGGMIATGVADQIKPRINKVIFLDAPVPADGNDFASSIPNLSQEQADKRRQFFINLSKDGIWIKPLAPELAGVHDPIKVKYINERSRPFRLNTWLEPIRFQTNGLIGIAKTYILATNPPTELMGYPKHGELARKSDEWSYKEIDCGHAAMFIKPKEVARLILD